MFIKQPIHFRAFHISNIGEFLHMVEARIGGKAVEINAEQSCIISFDRPSSVSCGAQHEWINLRIKRSAIERSLTSLLGVNPNRELDLDPTASFRNPRLNGLIGLADFLT